jgi:trans-aconitate 2-methyltransferase
MTQWDAEGYLKFETERTRGASDLLTNIRIESPRNIVDLGCGPGNSTALLWRRWPGARVIGIDSSPEMIGAAKRAYPDREWRCDDIASYAPPEGVDVLFSNAAIHWLPNHRELVRRLLGHVAPGGVLAFQIPSRTFPRVRELIFEISRWPQWDERMAGARSALTMESPEFYYDVLAADAKSVDIWETEYIHVMETASSIVDWVAGTGLRPFVAKLETQGERLVFFKELYRRVMSEYPERADGKVLFPFRRTFVVAYR